MKIMIDTNVLISAALFPKGHAAEALYKALVSPYQPGRIRHYIEHRKTKNAVSQANAMLWRAGLE